MPPMQPKAITLLKNIAIVFDANLRAELCCDCSLNTDRTFHLIFLNLIFISFYHFFELREEK